MTQCTNQFVVDSMFLFSFVFFFQHKWRNFIKTCQPSRQNKAHNKGGEEKRRRYKMKGPKSWQTKNPPMRMDRLRNKTKSSNLKPHLPHKEESMAERKKRSTASMPMDTKGQHTISHHMTNNILIYKVTLLSLILGPPITSKPLFQWYLQSKEILLNLNMKSSNSAFNAQDSRVTIVAQLRTEKMYVAAVEAIMKKERGDETQFITQKNPWFSQFHLLLNANVHFCRVFFSSHPVYDQTQGSGAVFSILYH